MEHEMFLATARQGLVPALRPQSFHQFLKARPRHVRVWAIAKLPDERLKATRVVSLFDELPGPFQLTPTRRRGWGWRCVSRKIDLGHGRRGEERGLPDLVLHAARNAWEDHNGVNARLHDLVGQCLSVRPAACSTV